jgi:hypothetical protein
VNELPIVRRVLRILLEPGWAPFSVLLLHAVLAEFGLTQRFDHLLHFLGGTSIAYFFFRLLDLFSLFPPTHHWAVYLVTFTSSCTTALFWEFTEFASDTFLHSTVQQSLSETMLDLLFSVLGATASLIILFWTERWRRRKGA